MKNILIGSRALRFWNPKLTLKDDADWDVISDTKIPGTEWHDPSILNNRNMAALVSTKTIDHNGYTFYVMSMEGLAIIKRSHLWRTYKFQSHITQYHKYGLANHIDLTHPLYIERLALTHKEYPNNHPKLNKGKDDFFSDAVTRKYDHDMLHELVGYPFEPVYKQLLVSPDQVLCSKDKWDSMHNIRKLRCVVEETTVTALERFIIPDSTYPHRHAYLKSLDKVCTTMCSGWFRDYAIDNYPTIINQEYKHDIIRTLTKLGELNGN